MCVCVCRVPEISFYFKNSPPKKQTVQVISACYIYIITWQPFKALKKSYFIQENMELSSWKTSLFLHATTSYFFSYFLQLRFSSLLSGSSSRNSEEHKNSSFFAPPPPPTYSLLLLRPTTTRFICLFFFHGHSKKKKQKNSCSSS